MNDLYFKSLIEHKEGTIFNLLNRCYDGLDKIKPEYFKEWENDWKDYDNEIFHNPNTIGACGFISYLDDIVVGFASWDPRKYPTGIIGFNYILPQFQGNGYGRYQINEIIKRFKQINFTKALVSTMDHDFFMQPRKCILLVDLMKKEDLLIKIRIIN
jgi:GNAT superfamily N-acetyltransferase